MDVSLMKILQQLCAVKKDVEIVLHFVFWVDGVNDLPMRDRMRPGPTLVCNPVQTQVNLGTDVQFLRHNILKISFYLPKPPFLNQNLKSRAEKGGGEHPAPMCCGALAGQYNVMCCGASHTSSALPTTPQQAVCWRG